MYFKRGVAAGGCYSKFKFEQGNFCPLDILANWRTVLTSALWYFAVCHERRLTGSQFLTSQCRFMAESELTAFYTLSDSSTPKPDF
jgi:hypothetical protein